MNAYFGEDWHVPATEGQPHVATPVGKPCLWCGVPIQDGDRGFIMPCLGVNAIGEQCVSRHPVHRECQMREVFGSPAHLDGRCTCCGGSPDDRPQTPQEMRAEAIEVWDRITSGGFR